jgi:hypothetical protein
MACINPENPLLRCQNWSPYVNNKFPQDISLYKGHQTDSVKGIGGINNSKNYRTSGSSFTLLKKSLTTVQNINNKSNLAKNANTGSPNTSYTNTGGPGDNIASVPIITHSASGSKGRLIAKTRHTGVDVKHNSYERYLARKRGINMICQNC